MYASKIKLAQQEVAKEKSARVTTEQEIETAREHKEALEKELKHQKNLGTKHNQDVVNNLAKNLESMQNELEADKRSIASAEKAVKKLLREYEEMQFDLVDEQKLKEEAEQYFAEEQQQVAEIQQEFLTLEVVLTRQQAIVKRIEKEGANDRSRIPLLERELRKLRNELEEEIQQQEQLNLQMSTMKVAMRDEIDYFSDDDEMSDVADQEEQDEPQKTVEVPAEEQPMEATEEQIEA
jgi:chromosome segregation ATPase